VPVRHAVELEAFSKAEEKRGDCYGYIRTTVPTQGKSNTDNAITELLKKMQSALTDLQKEVKSLKDAHNLAVNSQALRAWPRRHTAKYNPFSSFVQ
jgi:hypothetical protein